MAFEPCQSGSGDLLLLRAVHGFKWLAGIRGAAGFDFDKDNLLAVDCDDVDFAEMSLMLAFKNAIAELL